MTFLKRLTDRLDNFILLTGRLVIWLNLLLVLVILAQVILRYVFHRGMVPLEELQWHLYASAFILGLAYALVKDAHVRVDVLRDRFSPGARAIIEILGILLLLLPFVLVIIDHSLDWVAYSWRMDESSPNPTGLPYRWLIKATIPIGFSLLLVAAISRLLRQVLTLMNGATHEP